MLGRILVAAGALMTLVTLFFVEENVRGKHAWNQYRQQLEARGEKLDYLAFVPPPVPDDQNFAMTPFLAPLFDFNPDYQDDSEKPFPWNLLDLIRKPIKPGQSYWRDTNAIQRTRDFAKNIIPIFGPTDSPAWTIGQFTDFQASIQKTNAGTFAARTLSTRTESAAELLRKLNQYDAVINELRAASQRPYARFNMSYTNEFAPLIMGSHISVLLRANMAFQLRASAELALNQTEEAWSDTRMALYLADTIKNEPFKMSELNRNSMVQRSIQTIWEGLAERKWSETQLCEMEQRLGQTAILTPKTLRGELAFMILALDQMRTISELDWHLFANQFTSIKIPHFLLPDGWVYRNQLSFARSFEELVLPVIDGPERVYPAKASANMTILKKEYGGDDCFSPDKFLIKRYLLLENKEYALFESVRSLALGQTHVNEAMVACALERYRLANGQFPETLNAISPQYLEKIPLDLITGEPLKYRRTGDGQFVLYSVGWNEKDDGGTVEMTRSETPRVDASLGDWVWQYPAK
jgi:hypothetical protein